MPKSAKGKKLHFLYFVDASKTKQASIGLRTLYTLAVALFALIAYCVILSILFANQKREFIALTNYVKELKLSVVEKAVPSVAQDTVKLSAKEAPTEVPVVQQPTAPAQTITAPAKSATKGVGFQNVTLETSGSQTEVGFELVNQTRKALSGWVCASIQLKDGSWLSHPSNLKSSSEEQTDCKNGEFVRFARLRPTAFEFATAKENIGKIVLIFSDSGSLGTQNHVVTF